MSRTSGNTTQLLGSNDLDKTRYCENQIKDNK